MPGIPRCLTGEEAPSVNIYVGNLPFRMTDAELQALFAPFGTVASARIVMDRETGRSRGFGFVEMPSPDEGMKAIEALNGQDHGGRALTVNEAKPKGPRQGGGGRAW
ncbi:MAG: RNA-binding protein [Phycisphaeraceae bacterium]|nr:RNA-binding protein [Phycisphaeraceae bacterium]